MGRRVRARMPSPPSVPVVADPRLMAAPTPAPADALTSSKAMAANIQAALDRRDSAGMTALFREARLSGLDPDLIRQQIVVTPEQALEIARTPPASL